jgi:hypothetical protein
MMWNRKVRWNLEEDIGIALARVSMQDGDLTSLGDEVRAWSPAQLGVIH